MKFADRATPNPNRIRRQSDSEDLPTAVHKLLCVHILHRLFQGKIHRVPWKLQPFFRYKARGVRTRWLPPGAEHPTGHNHDRQASYELDTRNDLAVILQVDEYGSGTRWFKTVEHEK